MTIPEVPIRLRVHPGAEAKPVPKARRTWPACTVVFHTTHDVDGAMALGNLLELVGDWVVAEHLVFPGATAPDELAAYCDSHRAQVIAGPDRRIQVLSTAVVHTAQGTTGLGYVLRDRGYRRGWAVVTAGVGRQFAGIAEHWSEARRSPGSWSIALCGLGEWAKADGRLRYVSLPDAPRVHLTALGDHVLVRWGTTKRQDGDREQSEHYRRPPPKRGPIVDVLAVVGALSGQSVTDLDAACPLLGVPAPTGVLDPVDRLRAETRSIGDLYLAARRLILGFDLGLDLSTLVSTGGIATALLREMEHPR